MKPYTHKPIAGLPQVDRCDINSMSLAVVFDGIARGRWGRLET